ncbi:hypothetical protein HZB69_03600 [Candidatus Amesbacteria bacterium]|nr:hypothetical protein [Candidatus Amesbacteria bacterium]
MAREGIIEEDNYWHESLVAVNTGKVGWENEYKELVKRFETDSVKSGLISVVHGLGWLIGRPSFRSNY